MDGDFWDDYDLRVQHLKLAGYKTLSDRLRVWFRVLDSHADVASEVERLEKSVDLTEWKKERDSTIGGMVGSGELEWPEDETARLGAQLGLARQWSKNIDAANEFAMDFFGITKFDEGTSELKQQIIFPLTDDLKRYLKRRFRSTPNPVPASDRVVTIDHNSHQTVSAVEAVTAVKAAISATNDYADSDDKQRQIAELSAGQELLKAARVRVEALQMVLVRCLKYLGDKFVDHAIGALVTIAISALLALFGVHII